jgi:DNA-binding transcriptional ArsR family regulator
VQPKRKVQKRLFKPQRGGCILDAIVLQSLKVHTRFVQKWMVNMESKNHFTPVDVRPITDLLTMKLLVAPRRVQILSLLIEADRTVKEVAEIVQIPASRLYYHFNLLEESGLITVVETRKVAGTLEKRYRAVALNYLVDPSLLLPDSPLRHQALEAMLFNTLDTTRRDIVASVHAGLADLAVRPPEPNALFLRRCELQLTSTQAQQLYGLLESATNEPQPDGEETRSYVVTTALFPFDPALRGPVEGESSPA